MSLTTLRKNKALELFTAKRNRRIEREYQLRYSYVCRSNVDYRGGRDYLNSVPSWKDTEWYDYKRILDAVYVEVWLLNQQSVIGSVQMTEKSWQTIRTKQRDVKFHEMLPIVSGWIATDQPRKETIELNIITFEIHRKRVRSPDRDYGYGEDWHYYLIYKDDDQKRLENLNNFEFAHDTYGVSERDYNYG